MPKPTPISREQTIEWLENPVTLVFKEVAQEYIDEINNQRGLDCYFQGDPQKTQEAMAQLNGEFIAWSEVVEALSGLGGLEQDEDEERIGDNSEG